jgi:hypothetical protein
MPSKHPPTIDLAASQNRLDDLGHQRLADPLPPPFNGDVTALAIETAGNANERGGLGTQGTDIEPRAEPQASPPVPQLGVEAAGNMTKLSKAAAADIRGLGLLAFKAGKQVQDECEQMARDVEANGSTVALHLTGLSQLFADVGMSNRETLRRLSGGASPSIVPAAGNGGGAKQPASIVKALGEAPLSKGSDVKTPKFLGRS